MTILADADIIMRTATCFDDFEMTPKGFVRRRFIMGVSILSASVALSSVAHARSITGFAAIDSPSIPVKAPASVLLISIARCASRLVAVGEEGVIIYSDDEGAHWTQASVPVMVTLTSVCFISATSGWAAGHFGVVLGTIDRGKTWTVKLTGIEANQLTLQAAQSDTIKDNPSPGAPLALRRAKVFMQAGPDKPFLTLLTIGPETVMAFGAYRMTMMTADAGQSWQDWSLHIYDKYSHNIYDAVSVQNNLYLVGEQGLVFRSADNGETFLPVTPPSGVTLFGIIGCPDGSLVVFGVAGSCFRSVDSGNSWTPLELGTQDNIAAGRMLRSGALIIASEAGGLFLSRDNGASFKQVPDVQLGSIFDLEETPERNLVVVGGGGVIQVSSAVLDI